MVGTRNGKKYVPSAASHGRLYDAARKQSMAKKKQARGPSKKKVTRAGVAHVSTPPELKGVGKS
eukprot:scaffold603063_cov197-Attheya_sp.AAC.1